MLDAEPLEQRRLVDQAVGFERRSHPEPLGVLQGKPDGLADRGRDLIPHRLGDGHLVQEALVGQQVEQRSLSAPEDVRLGLPLPLDDLAIGDRCTLRHGAGLEIHVILLLHIGREGLQGRIMDILGDRGDEIKLILDRLGRRRRPQQQNRDNRHSEEPPEILHWFPPCLLRSAHSETPNPSAGRRPADRWGFLLVSALRDEDGGTAISSMAVYVEPQGVSSPASLVSLAPGIPQGAERVYRIFAALVA